MSTTFPSSLPMAASSRFPKHGAGACASMDVYAQYTAERKPLLWLLRTSLSLQAPEEASHMTAPEGSMLAAAQPVSGRAPRTGCRAQEVPRDKTVACAASAQRTLDMRPRHSAGRPPVWRCEGDASRPWQ